MDTDTNSKPISTFARILLTALLLLLALTVLVQSNPGTRLPSRDYGYYVYIGDQIVHGKLPYRDAWESKPPAIFYLDAIALWIGRGSRWGVWIVELLSLLVAAIFSYNTLKKLWGLWPALAGLVIWLIGLDLTLQGGNLTEEYPLPLHFLSIALFLKLVESPKHRLYNILLGLAFSISFLFRPNNAVIEAAVILTLLVIQAFRREWKSIFTQILWLAVGALPPILITGLYFWSQGLFQELLNASILYNLAYSSTAITSASPLKTGFGIFGTLAWIAAAAYLIALYRMVKSKEPIYLLLLIGWPMAIYLSDPAKRNYAHYFINWLPFLALLGGLALHFLTSRLPPRIKDASAPVISVMLLLTAIFFTLSGRAAEYGKAIERITDRARLGIEIRTRTAVYAENHTNPNDLVLFWAATPGENFMSNRQSPSAYLFYPLYVRSDISKRMNDQFLRDIIAKRPALIVDVGDHEALSLNPEQRAQQIASGFAWEYPPDNLDQFFKFVDDNYYLEAMVGDKAVYRLK